MAPVFRPLVPKPAKPTYTTTKYLCRLISYIQSFEFIMQEKKCPSASPPPEQQAAVQHLCTCLAMRSSRMSSFRRSFPSNMTFWTALPRISLCSSNTARCAFSSSGGSGTLFKIRFNADGCPLRGVLFRVSWRSSWRSSDWILCRGGRRSVVGDCPTHDGLFSSQSSVSQGVRSCGVPRRILRCSGLQEMRATEHLAVLPLLQ